MAISPDIALSAVIFERKEMRLSDSQAIRLYHILYDSCVIANMPMGGLNSKQRLEFYNKITRQQDCKIVELSNLSGIIEDEPEKTPTDSPASPDGN